MNFVGKFSNLVQRDREDRVVPDDAHGDDVRGARGPGSFNIVYALARVLAGFPLYASFEILLSILMQPYVLSISLSGFLRVQQVRLSGLYLMSELIHSYFLLHPRFKIYLRN